MQRFDETEKSTCYRRIKNSRARHGHFFAVADDGEKSISMFFSRVLRDPTPRFVGPSVRHTLLFFVFLGFLASLLLPKWSGNLNYGPCPPARDWGSRVSGLVFIRYFCGYFGNIILQNSVHKTKTNLADLILGYVSNLLKPPFYKRF